MPESKARQNAAHHAEHVYYDFAFGAFRFQGLEQHFWQPFEVGYRLRRAGFRHVRKSKVHLAWQQFGLRPRPRRRTATVGLVLPGSALMARLFRRSIPGKGLASAG